MLYAWDVGWLDYSPQRLWLEVAIVCAAGFAPWLPMPILAMFIAAALLNVIGGGSWGDGALATTRPRVTSSLVQCLTGVVIGAGSWLLLSFSFGVDRATGFPPADGSLSVLLTISVLVAALATAGELVFRGFVLPRIARATHWPLVGNAVAALGYGVALGGTDPGSVLGYFVIGLGFGFLYHASGDRLTMPIAASVTIAVLGPISSF